MLHVITVTTIFKAIYTLAFILGLSLWVYFFFGINILKIYVNNLYEFVAI